MHYALRYAHAAAKSCIDRDNIALGVCYISLGVRVATKGTDLEALLLLLDDVSSTISEQEGAYRSTYDHIAKVRVNILKSMARLDDKLLQQRRGIWDCFLRCIPLY